VCAPPPGPAGTGRISSSGRPVIQLDFDYLKGRGFLVPDDKTSKIHQEFRLVKRRLLDNAFGRLRPVVGNGRLIMVTSSLPSEGKTFSAINLAISIAIGGEHPVLLIDADIARPSVSNTLQLDIPSDISFRVNSAAILPNFQPILDRFAQTLVANPATTVQIIGHTDSTGTDAINNPLSVNRAASARDYLVARGVQVSRIMIDGRGSRDPIADNSTPAGRAQNRRVEIYVGQAASPEQQQRAGQYGNGQNGQYQGQGQNGQYNNGQYNRQGGQYNTGYQGGQRSSYQPQRGAGQWSQDGSYQGGDGYTQTIQ